MSEFYARPVRTSLQRNVEITCVSAQTADSPSSRTRFAGLGPLKALFNWDLRSVFSRCTRRTVSRADPCTGVARHRRLLPLVANSSDGPGEHVASRCCLHIVEGLTFHVTPVTKRLDSTVRRIAPVSG